MWSFEVAIDFVHQDRGVVEEVVERDATSLVRRPGQGPVATQVVPVLPPVAVVCSVVAR